MSNVISYRRESKALPHELLLMYRQRSGLTQSQVATRLGLKSDRMVQKWEGGYTLPTAPRLQSLIQLYLQAGILIPGKEREEAGKLWSAIKDMFDQNIATYESYPIFDEEWFEQLSLNPQAAVSQSPNVLNDNQKLLETKASNLQANRLPISPNRLIGREDEVKAIQARLRSGKQGVAVSRLLTLTGPGGTGKTRLAIQAVSELQTEFEQIWFVPLASVQNPRLVDVTIAQVLGLNERPGTSSLSE